MIDTLAVAVGGALGSVARLWVGLAVVFWLGGTAPYATLLINIVGSMLIGWFASVSLPDGRLPAPETFRILVMTGFCGGFTTFSAFSLQSLDMMRAGNWGGAALLVALSLVLCLAGAALGHLLSGRAF